MSLPRRRILRKRAHFLRVRTSGQAKPSRFLLVSVRRPDVNDLTPGAPSIFGFITPRYVGKAHERNRVRRRLRAIVRADDSQIAAGCHVVILARRGSGRANFSSLKLEWQRLARKLGLLPAPTPGLHS